MNPARSALSQIRKALARILTLDPLLDDIRMNQGLILSRLNESGTSRNLKDYEFKVFSQWGEDGIIQHLVNNIEIPNRNFIEFGVANFLESNCRFLLMKDNWSGFVIDSSAANVESIKGSYFYWKYHLVAVNAFITRENINALLAQSGFGEDLGLLSIDVDGIDYHLLEAINAFRPRILICEYNALFGPTRKITVPYEADFDRAAKHYSNLYWGASLAALSYLAARKGYGLVGTNSTGANAFFVRNDLLNDKLQALSGERAFTPAKFRQSRDRQGQLTCVAAEESAELIRGQPVLNVETNVLEKF